MNQELTKNEVVQEQASPGSALEVTITSFGYKEGPPPAAHMIFDVRFLKNPYWVDELRPLTGLDKPVSEYVLSQILAEDFLNSLTTLLAQVLPQFEAGKWREFTIALGCTGGQHRSTAMVEALALRLSKALPKYRIFKQHRELNLGFDRPLIVQPEVGSEETP